MVMESVVGGRGVILWSGGSDGVANNSIIVGGRRRLIRMIIAVRIRRRIGCVCGSGCDQLLLMVMMGLNCCCCVGVSCECCGCSGNSKGCCCCG